MQERVREVWRHRYVYLWMLPALLLVLFATVYPIIFAVDYSLYETSVFEKVEFVGLENYRELLTDSRFHSNLINSLFFTFGGVIIAMCVGFALAVLLRRPTTGNTIYRVIFLIPWITTEVVLALMWRWLLNPQGSPAIFAMTSLGLPEINLLQDLNLALPTVTVINALRGAGYALVMMLAALSAIPQEIEEAAAVEGGTKWQIVRHIFIPMVRPVALVSVIVLTISFFNIIVLVLDLTGGGPLGRTEILSIRLYREGFRYFDISVASVLTVFMLTINLVLAWIYLKLIKGEEYY